MYLSFNLYVDGRHHHKTLSFTVMLHVVFCAILWLSCVCGTSVSHVQELLCMWLWIYILNSQRILILILICIHAFTLCHS